MQKGEIGPGCISAWKEAKVVASYPDGDFKGVYFVNGRDDGLVIWGKCKIFPLDSFWERGVKFIVFKAFSSQHNESVG